MKTQIVIIGGGEWFATRKEYLKFLKGLPFDPYEERPKGWKENLEEDLGSRYEVLRVRMPNPLNAKYDEWKIHFDKVNPYIEAGAIVVCHSLGGLFLAKYLNENTLHRPLLGTIFVSAPYRKKGEDDLVDFQFVSHRRFQEQSGKFIVIQGSEDDIVPNEDSTRYVSNVKEAWGQVIVGKGHFIFEEHFPELVTLIKEIVKNS